MWSLGCVSLSTIISVSPKFKNQMHNSFISNIIITEKILVLQLSAINHEHRCMWRSTIHNPNRLLTAPMSQLWWTFSLSVWRVREWTQRHVSGLRSCSAACLLISSAVSGTCECLAACLSACWSFISFCNSDALPLTVSARSCCVSAASCVTHIVPLHSLRGLWHSGTDVKHVYKPMYL